MEIKKTLQATESLNHQPPKEQEENSYPSTTQGDYVADGAIDTHHVETDPLVALKVSNSPEQQNFSVLYAGGRGGPLIRRWAALPR